MASETQQIVEKLNEEPFSMGLTLVAFDEKGPRELLKLLNDVLVELEPAHRVDVRDEPAEAMGQRMSRFLDVLKYPVPAAGPEQARWVQGLTEGDRRVIYPILRYILPRLAVLKKRAYVARYLAKVDVPAEFQHDEAVQELQAQLQALQLHFREVHKEVDRLRGADSRPSELRRDVRQLEEEKSQLQEKIAHLKGRVEDLSGFPPLLAATSALRREQEEEAKLSERLMEQRQALAVAEKRYSEAARRLAEARSKAKEDMSGEEVLELARREEAENRRLLSEALPASLRARKETLERLLSKLSEPARSEEEVVGLRRQARALEARVRTLTEEVAAAQRAAGDDKLALYRQQAALVSRKRTEEEETLRALQGQVDDLRGAIETREARLSELSGPRFMRREEFRAYRESLLRKTQDFKVARARLAALRQETVVLARTEQLLRQQAGNVDEVLKKLEERRGVAGYVAVQEDLERVSALKAAIDETKGHTLAEISRIVTDITQALQERRTRLQPQIAELRQVRLDYAELEHNYLQVRGRWETSAAGLDARRSAVERECDLLQNECVEAERQAYLADIHAELVRDQAQRAKDEERFQAREAVLLRDFASWKDLYASKLAQQEQLARELRRKQRELNESGHERAEQRDAFEALRRILALKRTLYDEGKAGPSAAAREDAPGSTAVDHIAFSGANVMTITGGGEDDDAGAFEE